MGCAEGKINEVNENESKAIKKQSTTKKQEIEKNKSLTNTPNIPTDKVKTIYIENNLNNLNKETQIIKKNINSNEHIRNRTNEISNDFNSNADDIDDIKSIKNSVNSEQ